MSALWNLRKSTKRLPATRVSQINKHALRMCVFYLSNASKISDISDIFRMFLH